MYLWNSFHRLQSGNDAEARVSVSYDAIGSDAEAVLATNATYAVAE